MKKFKKALCLCMVVFLAFSLVGCAFEKGKTDEVKIIPWEKSKYYSDEDIYSAIEVTKKYFEEEFNGCTLTEITYIGDSEAELGENDFYDIAKENDADEVIVLVSSFHVGPHGGDGSLETDIDYDNWKWILVRKDKGSWRHLDHGY